MMEGPSVLPAKLPVLPEGCTYTLDFISVRKSLRKYPPLSSLPRICTKDYKLPGTDLTLEKGARIVIPVLGVHRDPDYYPDPEKFDPERFSEENKKNRKESTYLAFGYGPRHCIAKRFGMMQTKIGLLTLLRKYEFQVGARTQEPLKFDPKCLITTVLGNVWLKYKRVDNFFETN